MNQDRSRLFAPRLFLGLVVIALGLAALLDNLGVMQFHDPFRFWPLIFIAIGLARILRPAGCPGRFGGTIFLLIGGWLLLRNLGVIPYHSLFQFWPVLVLLIGLRLVWSAMTRHSQRGPETESTSQLSAFALLGSSEHKSNSDDFRGGEATSLLGGCKLDLRQAKIKGEAVIDTFAIWGGIEIFVPRDWTIVLMGSPILGSYEDKTQQADQPSGQRLVIKGMVIMGGVEIKN